MRSGDNGHKVMFGTDFVSRRAAPVKEHGRQAGNDDGDTQGGFDAASLQAVMSA
jgi:hypothetical protein